MKKLLLFILVIILSFVSCDTTTHYLIKVSVDRNPALIIENQTGHHVTVTAPVSSNININANMLYQPTETNQNINIVYMIGQVEFTEQATFSNEDTTVILTKRPPTITVVNQTGYDAELSAPERASVPNGSSYPILAPALNQTIDINYRIGRMNLIEQANMINQDITVNLRRPPTVTVVNNVGATINTIFMRTPGAPTWTGGNIVIRNGVVNLAAAGTAQATDISGSIVNRDSMQIWMGNITLTGDRFDIRIDDVQGNTYVKSNVQIRSDMTLTFTAGDRR